MLTEYRVRHPHEWMLMDKVGRLSVVSERMFGSIGQM